MPACKVCGHWFVKVKPQEELCEKCESALYRLSGYVAPVRHGRWIWRNKWEPLECKYECSICHDGSDLESKYCPNCGAKMDEGNQNV